MIIEQSVWVGADPGGKRSFGIAALTEGGRIVTASVSCTDEAVAFVGRIAERKVVGIGVDAPLWWSSGYSGDRHADQWLRKRYRLSGGQVQASNSLRGAALIQGVMFVQRMREKYPGVFVTESHPKALLKAVANGRWSAFAARYGILRMPRDEHARDALIGAIAARESLLGIWQHDLSDTRLEGEQDPKAYWLSPVHYYWPEV